MRDPNYVFPEDAVPRWVQRYTERSAARHDRFVSFTDGWLPGLRNRRGRRALAVTVLIFLDVTLIAAVASFWSTPWAAIPFGVGLAVSITALMTLRVVTGSVADAPAAVLDEIQLAQRNAARSICYSLIMPLMIVVYALLITLSMRDSVSSQTLVSTAWLLIACVYAISCLPDILVSWWTQDPDDEFPDPRTPTRRTPTRRTPP